MHRIFRPVNSYLYSMTALVNLQQQMLEHHALCTCYTVHGQGIHCARNYFQPQTMPPLYLFCFGFCNRKKIKHPVTLDLATFQICCTFTLKNQKGKFFGVAREDMINNTSGLQSTDCAALTLISPWRENKPRL